ncbi:MAG: hypothetical protein EZS28_042985 [Streblomastix strix]|uniref:Condensin complex subunit 1 C-terminal domain-containing protein n=1 Tax=Streblomastix strix TaxID=222440 RepID=A0A5J4TTE8_9EUKA|nr:MAG: hypothetical protein EZS28_042985 [Streblomastix strix]
MPELSSKQSITLSSEASFSRGSQAPLISKSTSPNFSKSNSQLFLLFTYRGEDDRNQDMISYFQIVDTLQISFNGNKNQKMGIQKEQEDAFLKISGRLKDKEDDEGRTEAIGAGVTQELINIFEKRDLTTISSIYVEAFLNFLIPYHEDLRNTIYLENQSYLGLFRLLNHKIIEVVRLAIRSIGSLFLCGLLGIKNTEPNLHFEIIESFSGDKKLFTPFKKAKDKQTKDDSSICIGILFHAKEIPEKNTRLAIIIHLISIVNDPNKWVKESSIEAISYLALNQKNFKQIMNDIDIKAITKDLMTECNGSEKQNKQLQIVDSLLTIFETRDLNRITLPYVDVILKLSESNDETVKLLYSKKLCPQLLRLLDHTINEVIRYSITSIANIINLGT